MKTKRCNKCKNDLPATMEFFHYSGTTLNRCSSHCKKCRAETYYLKRKPKESLSRLLAERFTDLKTRIKNKRVKYNVALNFDILYLEELYNKQKGLCAISKIPMTYLLYDGHNNTNISIDRIDSNKGYIRDNIQLVCSIINKMKLNMTLDELLFYCKHIIQNNG
jgi:hypothetical protein